MVEVGWASSLRTSPQAKLQFSQRKQQRNSAKRQIVNRIEHANLGLNWLFLRKHTRNQAKPRAKHCVATQRVAFIIYYFFPKKIVQNDVLVLEVQADEDVYTGIRPL